MFLLLAAVIVVAATLRAPLTVIGPIISEIGDTLSLNHAMLGGLTTIPLIMFGIVSPFVAKISGKIGMSMTLLSGKLLLLCGLIVRILPNVTWLITGTILVGTGIAIGNVILPSFVKWRFPAHIGLMTGVFAATMNLTAGIGGGLSVPLAHYNDYGYQFALGFWIIPSVIGLLVWLPQLKHNPKPAVSVSSHRIYHSKLAVTIALMMGFQSMNFYSTVTWFPEILIHYGVSQETAGYMLMLNQFAQLPMTFMMPVIAMKMNNQRPLVIAFTMLFLIGFTALQFNHIVWIVIGMIATGLAGGAAFSLCMLFFSLRARTNEDAIKLSGFSQSVGYIIAAIGPVLMGYLNDMTGTYTTSFIMFYIIAICMFIFGMIASKNEYV
ncbi:MFS transporter [Macrococcus caseolyticus]|uniref:CynX/NimT family MFS transporter n=1 Tax=Macrococcoides caseolyticum TaxID=69966 RepID=UPI002DB6C3B0|nr:MFS transporter [Macrococcus caseolyticus]MEB8170222.1 MFS transporter [Macrococcus caseolyticus]